MRIFLSVLLFIFVFCAVSLAQDTVQWRSYVDSGNEVWFQAPESILINRNSDTNSVTLHAFVNGVSISVSKQSLKQNPLRYVRRLKLPFGERGTTTQDYKLAKFLIRQEIEPRGNDVRVTLYAGSDKSYFRISLIGAKGNPQISRFVETIRFGGSRLRPDSNAQDMKAENESIIFDELPISPEIETALAKKRPSPESDTKVEVIRQYSPLKLDKLSRELIIVQMPRPPYTDAARRRQVQGTIPVNVEFLANGDIGTIIVDDRLDAGLAKNVIEAVRKIKFVPAQADGNPVDVVRTMLYRFSIY